MNDVQWWDVWWHYADTYMQDAVGWTAYVTVTKEAAWVHGKIPFHQQGTSGSYSTNSTFIDGCGKYKVDMHYQQVGPRYGVDRAIDVNRAYEIDVPCQ
ncbi:hypothetical protein ACH4U6_37170 [Streptomyces netropsis]|uniref:hypothetical protein n=1 Tax=Streptomyces netropsis TaxID=55404 RepID=UPI0037980806